MTRKKKTSFKKGIELEEKFAQYMKEELEYKKTRTRAHLPGKDNVKGYEADILAEKEDKMRDLLINIGEFLGIIGIIAFIIGLLELLDQQTNDFLFNWGMVFFIIAIFIGIMTHFIWHKEYAWVECKNLKSKANINQISTLHRNLEDYNNVENNEYKITQLIFVSTNGFIENAIKYAENKNIECYETDKKERFIESTYWS